MRSIKESICKFCLIQEDYTPSTGNEKSPQKETHPHEKARSSTLLQIIKNAFHCYSYCIQRERERERLLFVFTVLMNTGRFFLIKVQEEELRVK
jgi:hypothetical protein